MGETLGRDLPVWFMKFGGSSLIGVEVSDGLIGRELLEFRNIWTRFTSWSNFSPEITMILEQPFCVALIFRCLMKQKRAARLRRGWLGNLINIFINNVRRLVVAASVSTAVQWKSRFTADHRSLAGWMVCWFYYWIRSWMTVWLEICALDDVLLPRSELRARRTW